jgi:threonine/homoserine/homoserine lactone efflux protein
MGESIGQVLVFAVGVALSPIPIIAVVLMLATPKGGVNGPAFLIGWMLGLAAAGTILLFAASGGSASSGGAPADWVSIVKIALGLLLFGVAARQWRSRPHGDAEPELPAWMETVNTFTPPRAAGLAVLLSAANPKNLIFIAGAAAAIAGTGVSTGDQAVALAVFVIVASLGPGIPVAIYFLMRDRASAILENLRGWMARENTTIMAVLCLIIGAKLIGDAISGLAS